jgi:hypothetical protein
MHFKVGVITRVIPAVLYGYVTIRFDKGEPVLIERHETVKLPGGDRRGT